MKVGNDPVLRLHDFAAATIRRAVATQLAFPVKSTRRSVRETGASSKPGGRMPDMCHMDAVQEARYQMQNSGCARSEPRQHSQSVLGMFIGSCQGVATQSSRGTVI